MKKSLKIVLSIVLAASILCGGTVFAMMLVRSQAEENNFTPAVVSCEVEEDFDGTQKTEIQVKNTGNISAYLRVCLVTYWVNDKDEVVAKPSEMPEIAYNEESWIKGGDNIYYYKTPVAPGFSTENLLSGAIVLQTDDENGYFQVIEVFAEAIQAEPDDAVIGSWKVTLDGSGKITAVP
ncbi:MAG: hypothetical protein E7479_03755 [Ruminococcaceae bacterium]|nr:hypothetical protein [Oscillospiraceae bacterium]